MGRHLLAPALLVAALGALIEIVLLRRIYQAPELFQLLATFALVLIINDATQYLWGPEDLLGPRAPGLRGSIEILGPQFSELRSFAHRDRARSSCCSCTDARQDAFRRG